MPVATVDFECEYDGELIRLTAGRDIVADRHELVRRFPNYFAPDSSSHVPPRRASAWRETVTHPGRSRRALPERYKVEFTRWAQYDLDLALGEFDGLEIGGGLFGHVDGDTIVVEAVGQQVPGVDRTTSRTELSAWGCEEFARTSGLTWVGDYHVHDRGDGSPSDVDVRGWQSCRSAGSPWLGLIVTPGPDPIWAMCDAHYHAWTVSDKGLKAASLQQRS